MFLQGELKRLCERFLAKWSDRGAKWEALPFQAGLLGKEKPDMVAHPDGMRPRSEPVGRVHAAATQRALPTVEKKPPAALPSVLVAQRTSRYASFLGLSDVLHLAFLNGRIKYNRTVAKRFFAGKIIAQLKLNNSPAMGCLIRPKCALSLPPGFDSQ